MRLYLRVDIGHRALMHTHKCMTLISLPTLDVMECRKLQAEYERVSREVEVHRLKEEREALMKKRDMLLKQQHEDTLQQVGYKLVLPTCILAH